MVDRRKAPGLGRYPLLVGIAVVVAAPLLWMVTTSFKSRQEALRTPPTLLPDQWVTDAYSTLFGSSQAPVLRWFLNSLLAATGHTLLVLVVASLAAYALARLEFPGKQVIFAVIISTLLIPGFVLLIPNFLIVDRLGWLDSLWALVVPGAASAFGVFFLRQFFLALPRDLEEAALIEGANQFQIFLWVVLPLSKPALATLALLSFLANWNDFLWPVYVMFSTERMTLPPGLATLQSAFVTDYPVLMAGAVVASVPVLVLFVIAQRYVIENISRTGIKG